MNMMSTGSTVGWTKLPCTTGRLVIQDLGDVSGCSGLTVKHITSRPARRGTVCCKRWDRPRGGGSVLSSSCVRPTSNHRPKDISTRSIESLIFALHHPCITSRGTLSTHIHGGYHWSMDPGLWCSDFAVRSGRNLGDVAVIVLCAMIECNGPGASKV